MRGLIPFLFLAALVAPAQTQPRQDVIRVDVNLVQVDAVVTDSKGNVVTDLTQNDFEIVQDGKSQPITNFSFVRTGTAPSERAGATVNAPGTAEKLTREKVRRSFALVVDDLGLSVETAVYVRTALHKFVDQQMEEGDLVAIIRTGSGMGALQQFTTNKRLLHAAIDHIQYSLFSRIPLPTVRPDRIVDAAVAAAGGSAPNLSETVDYNDSDREADFALGSLGTMRYIIQGLAALPGRKSAILFSEEMRINRTDNNERDARITQALRGLVNLANRSSVVFYTINPAAVSSTAPNPDDEAGMSDLAQETGGVFYHNLNDISYAVDRILAAQEGYYLIGYRPDAATFDPSTGRRLFKEVEVRVLRDGLDVRSRNGFIGDPTRTAPARAEPRTPEEKLIAATLSPFDSGDIRVRLTALQSHDAKDGPAITVLFHIDANDLTFTEEEGGVRKASIEVFSAVFGDNGQVIDKAAKTFQITLRGDGYRKFLENGALYSLVQMVKKPGPYQVRAAVLDAGSQKVGSASQFVDVPDFNSGKLFLSGIAVEGAPDAEHPPAPSASPAVRAFRPGDKFVYTYQILNPLTDRQKHSSLEAQTRVIQDGKLIYAGQPIPLEFDESGDRKHRQGGGVMSLTEEMEPGDYVLQIVVNDKLNKKGEPRVASEWIDFTVRPD